MNGILIIDNFGRPYGAANLRFGRENLVVDYIEKLEDSIRGKLRSG